MLAPQQYTQHPSSAPTQVVVTSSPQNYLHILTKKSDTQLSLIDKAWRMHPFCDRWGQKLSLYADQQVKYSKLLDQQGLENTHIPHPMRPETIFISWQTSWILKSPWPTRLGEYTHSTTDEVGNYLHILTNKSDTQLSLIDKAWRIHPFRDRRDQKLSLYPDQWGRYSSLLDRRGWENTLFP
jgi:hypothetical protein